VPEKPGDVVRVESRIVFAGGDPQIFGKGKLPLPEDRVGDGEQFLRNALAGV
jgi:hypothetical protein